MTHPRNLQDLTALRWYRESLMLKLHPPVREGEALIGRTWVEQGHEPSVPTKVWLVMHYDYSQTDYVGIFDSFEAVLAEYPDSSKQWWEQDKSGGFSRKFPATYGPGLDSDYYAEEVEVRTVAEIAEKRRVR